MRSTQMRPQQFVANTFILQNAFKKFEKAPFSTYIVNCILVFYEFSYNPETKFTFCDS